MDRRTFLRGFAGLAAIAASRPSLAALTQTDRDRLVAQMREGGLIEDQTFVIRDGSPVVLAVDDLTIRRCRFVWTRPCEGACIVVKGKNLCLESCFIEGSLAGGVSIRPVMGREAA